MSFLLDDRGKNAFLQSFECRYAAATCMLLSRKTTEEKKTNKQAKGQIGDRPLVVF